MISRIEAMTLLYLHKQHEYHIEPRKHIYIQTTPTRSLIFCHFTFAESILKHAKSSLPFHGLTPNSINAIMPFTYSKMPTTFDHDFSRKHYRYIFVYPTHL